MRVLFGLLLLIVFISGCGSSQTEERGQEKEKVVENRESEKSVLGETETVENNVTEEAKTGVSEEKEETEAKVNEERNEAEVRESSIDTSVFEYAKKVEVTDARNTTKHITVTVFMSDELTEGLAAQHVLNQTYDFIQQEDVKQAKTLTVGVMVGEKRVFQYTVETAKFVPNENERMAYVVLAASKVEKISPDVEEFAKIFGWKMNR